MTTHKTNPKMLHLLKLIEEKRVKQGISKYRISKETGHSQQQVGKILKGEHTPNFSTVMDILDVLGYELTIKKTPPHPSNK